MLQSRGQDLSVALHWDAAGESKLCTKVDCNCLLLFPTKNLNVCSGHQSLQLEGSVRHCENAIRLTGYDGAMEVLKTILLHTECGFPELAICSQPLFEDPLNVPPLVSCNLWKALRVVSTHLSSTAAPVTTSRFFAASAIIQLGRRARKNVDLIY